jgi:hypothetical protein
MSDWFGLSHLTSKSTPLDGRAPLHSLRMGWRNSASFPDFCNNRQFYDIYCVYSAYVLYFEEFLIHDSRGFMILKNN